MALAMLLAPTSAIADVTGGVQAPLIAGLAVHRSNDLTCLDIQMPTLWAPLIVLRRGERMLVRVFRSSLPGAYMGIALVVIRPHVLAILAIAAEDDPRGLRRYCCCHLCKFLS